MTPSDGPRGLTLVTGAGSGIGAAVADAVIAAGGRVVALDRDEGALRAGHRRLGPSYLPRVADVSDERAVREVVAQIEAGEGPIEALVNAAGVLALGEVSGGASADLLSTALAVNVGGVWATAQAVSPHMKRRKRGAIVTVSSNAGSTPRVGMAAYCASKAAATMLTQCLALELGPHGVRCNVVSPGSTDTPMLRSMLAGASPDALVRGDPSAYRLGIPLGRIAAPEDVAHVVLFLLSDSARHVTLQNVRVDGGATL